MTTPEQPAGRVEESYALSPLQLGMLFHASLSANTGVDIEQITCELTEELEVGCLRRAWEQLVARYGILRTRFSWEREEFAPRQEVCAAAPLDWVQLDWHASAVEAQNLQWSELLQSDRRRGFDLSQLPLMRLTLVALAPARFKLLWTFHHILLDGRSFPILLRELFALYDALRNGCALALPHPCPYKQFIDWLGEQRFERAEPYWRNLLKGLQAPARIDLPRASPLAEGDAAIQGVAEIELATPSSAVLGDFARSQGITVNTLVQGAWALLLHYYSGGDDVIFGATRACRHSPLGGAQDMAGLFINTLPLRVKIDADAPLLSWLRDLRAQQIALRAYEHTPLVKVQEWSDVPAGTPLFESIVVFENQSLDSMMRTGSDAHPERHFAYCGQTNYPLTLIAYNDDRLLLRLEYDRRRYDDAAGERLLAHFQTLLQGLVAAGERKLGTVPWCSKAEQQQLAASAAPTVHLAPERCLHELFEAQAQRTPNKIAVSCAGEELTYGELNRRANRLAHRLRAAGVGPDVLVGLCAERSLALVVGVLAIHKAGGAYLPLDPNYPTERLAFMLSDAQVKIILAQDQHRTALSRVIARQSEIISLDQDRQDSEPAADENLSNLTAPGNLAYVIYTSGSTGKPKGTLISHYNVVRLFKATEQDYRFGAEDVWTLFHSYAFDFSVWEIWGALLYGGRLVVVPYAVSRSPEEFSALLQQEGVTVLNQTPSAFRQLMPHFVAAVAPDQMALRYVIFGGEALELQSLQPWFERYGDQRPALINMYGITETTVHVTYRRITQADLRAGTGSVIGRPLADLQVYLLNSRQQLVPHGVAGEMYVGGAGVARGYWQRRELTAKRFVADPFGHGSDALLYRSGDLARRLPNGELEYLGRIDDQVKIRGFRIELGEIEAVLGRHPRVKAAAVLAREDTPGDKRLVAYFVANGAVRVDELRQAALTALPDYMVPAAFVELANLPLTANGKLDRKALPAPDHLRPEFEERYVAPRGPVEESLCAIWGRVLGVEKVGINDNFFALGGDSILSLQVFARARAAGLELRPRDLFAHPTVAGLAQVCRPMASAPMEQSSAEGEVALTPIQRWFFEQQLADANHWNQAFLLATRETLDLAALEAALQRVVEHHDSLRLRYFRSGSGWQQRYESQQPVALEHVDLAHLPAAEREAALTAAARVRQQRLNIATGQVLLATYFRLGLELGDRLLLIIHHLVVDGVSWAILLEDLETAYSALRAKQPVVLPARTASLQSWSKCLSGYANSVPVAAEAAYWRGIGAGPTALPIDGDRQAVNREAASRTLTVRLSAAESRTLLQEAPVAFHAQINDLLLAALAQTLSAWVRADSLVIDVEGHGREGIDPAVDLSRTVGWFTTIYPVRLDLRPVNSVVERLRAMKESLGAISQHGLGYSALRYLSGDESLRHALGAQPERALVFNYLGQIDQWLACSSLFAFAKENCGPWHGDSNARRHQIEVLAALRAGCFEVQWTYSENLHQEITIARLAESYLNALRALLAARATDSVKALVPADFPLATIERAALDRLLRDYPAAQDIYPLSPVQKLFFSADAAGTALGLEQWHCQLTGALDVATFKRAWQQLIERHTILRTAFVGEGLGEPLQIVNATAQLGWVEGDWRDSVGAEQQQRLSAFLERDRELGFQLDRAPLMRCGLFRLADDRYHFVWTTHHLLIDGWSWPLVFKDLAALYDDAVRGNPVPAVATCPYRAYIAWLQDRSVAAAESFWRRELAGLKAPTPLVRRERALLSAGRARGFGEERFVLDAQTTQALQDYARAQQVTLNSVIHAAWALLLSRLSGAEEVVFGATFSGRPADAPGMETMVGPCITNLPVRVRLAQQEPLTVWLRHHQEHLGELGQFQYLSPLEIQGWSEIPWHQRLFESLLVFQNYQTDDCDKRFGTGVVIDQLVGPYTTNYPMTVVITPGSELQVWLVYQTPHFAAAQVAPIAAALQEMLAAWAACRATTWEDSLALAANLPMVVANDAVRENRAPQMIAPQNEQQRKLLEIWREAFQRDAIGIDDNFFDLGGHSVLMVQTHKRLRQVLDRDLSIVKMFQYPTIRTLAQFLDGESDRNWIHERARQRAAKQKAAFERNQNRGALTKR